MRQPCAGVDRGKPEKPGLCGFYLFAQWWLESSETGKCLCQQLFFMALLAAGVPCLAMAQVAPARQSPATPGYVYMHFAEQPCIQAGQERLFRYGFADDWQLLQQCRSVHDLWWVLDIKPRLLRNVYAVAPQKNAHGIVFEFDPDFSTRFERLTRENYAGPPKWMPPALAYWDAGIGDWRYLRPEVHMSITDTLAEPELMMLWIKYESYEQGISWDASFDFDNLLELLGVARMNFGTLLSRFLEVFNIEQE